MKEIVDQILDLSKMRLNKLELNNKNVNVYALLQKLHTTFLPLFTEKGIELLLNTPIKKIHVNADAIYLERAISNLILNSLKYTDSGKVTLSTQLHDDKAIIDIVDTGIGIKKDDQEKIFREFYQVDNEINSAGGSGVGLTFVKNVIELQGGALNIESDLGIGTKASIALKSSVVKSSVIEGKLMPQKKKTITAKSKALKRRTILIVEDHNEMLLFLKSLLSNEYQIEEAKNGLEGLSVLSKKKIDFILTDYMMPKMNGEEFIKQLRDQGNDTPVIMLTARTDLATKLNVLRLGIDDYLNKPFSSDELLIKIENRLRNYSEAIEGKDSKTTVTETSQFINDISIFIDGNCHDSNFKIDNICMQFGYSESSLFRKTKSETGLSPEALIKEVRFLKARKLLEEKQVSSLKRLSLSVGIKNSSYFKSQYFDRFGSHIKDHI